MNDDVRVTGLESIAELTRYALTSNDFSTDAERAAYLRGLWRTPPPAPPEGGDAAAPPGM